MNIVTDRFQEWLINRASATSNSNEKRKWLAVIVYLTVQQLFNKEDWQGSETN